MHRACQFVRAIISAGEQTTASHSAEDGLRWLSLTMKKPCFFHQSRAHKLAQRAYQAEPRPLRLPLTQPGKSATLAHALDANLTTKPAISGQK